MFEACCLDPETSSKTDFETKQKATAMVRESLSHVANLVSQHAKVMALSESTLSGEQVQFLMTQITRVLTEELEDHPSTLESVLGRLEKVKIPDKKASVTHISIT